jgi:hypothetical protein
VAHLIVADGVTERFVGNLVVATKDFMEGECLVLVGGGGL